MIKACEFSCGNSRLSVVFMEALKASEELRAVLANKQLQDLSKLLNIDTADNGLDLEAALMSSEKKLMDLILQMHQAFDAIITEPVLQTRFNMYAAAFETIDSWLVENYKSGNYFKYGDLSYYLNLHTKLLLAKTETRDAIRVELNKIAEQAKLVEREAIIAGQAARIAELESRIAAQAKIEEQTVRMAEQAARIAELEFRMAEQARAAEQARLAEQARAAEQARLAEQARAAEQARLAEQARAAEQARLAEQARAAEQARLAEQARAAEQARLAEQDRAAEQARLAERARTLAARALAEERQAKISNLSSKSHSTVLSHHMAVYKAVRETPELIDLKSASPRTQSAIQAAYGF